MGTLAISMFITLDGVLQAPGKSDEDPDNGFDHGGWQVPYFDEDIGPIMTEQMARFDALLLGRKTYEIWAAYWPAVSDDDPIAARLNSVRKYVASRTLTTVDWNNAHLITGDVPEQVAKLKDDHDEIHLMGSGNLAQTLMAHDLVDRYYLWTYPVLLGGGKRLFAGGTVPSALRLVESTTLGSGACITVYERIGKPEYGSV